MTVAADIPLDRQQHIVFDAVSWDLYEHLLREVGDRPVRMTYSVGRLEIMSPLPKHEKWGSRIGRFIELMCLERGIQIVSLGSTTFRDRAKQAGLEPDECYYVQHAHAATDIEDAFDSAMHPPPDLAVEVDITSRSVAREPVYAALGGPELWRFDGRRLAVWALAAGGQYREHAASLAFPFLPVEQFRRFLDRAHHEDELAVLREFQQWVRQLPT